MAKVGRRPSKDVPDLLAPDARNSPMSHPDNPDGPPMGRRKSLFPPMKGAKGLAAALVKRGSKHVGKPGVDTEREKSGMHIPSNLEPTYRMEPHNKFFAPQVHTLLKQILEAHLDDFKYNVKFTPTMTKVLSDEIKERSKGLGFERYKLVVSVVMGERKDQGLMISSRAAWDAKLDSYATYTFQNNTLFCTASVYGVYAE